ncbi:hypothetical protein SAMN04487948_11615 [Halogranum amylolyticum]|uniref:Uncharacterized protein n=1 Tax=Halogranum amylolyticum TaxID=660520 RepID=A0A1H8VE61_9EURY|nr:hypothetical protein SAMN04487948_11615 [Halogranum amylolyticum]
MGEQEQPLTYNRLLAAFLLAILLVIALGVGYALMFDCIIGCPG